MTWFKGLEDNSINSWKELYDKFAYHFTARRKQLKTMDVLNGIVQDTKETLKEYVERVWKSMTSKIS